MTGSQLASRLALTQDLELLQALQAPVDLLPLALPFLQWLAPAMLLDAWNASMGSVMRAHLRVSKNKNKRRAMDNDEDEDGEDEDDDDEAGGVHLSDLLDEPTSNNTMYAL